ncbi:16S rRNA (cytidine(1402)-2'-O)-methyltransferase [Candidatus Desantisbacteria bacterium]|nr:16S rRNA (cytidine(1402)-2'-O)-methyltransferase [Candidatus Desantisbacteria bacterium]
MMKPQKGTLYLVSTPIGNLEDISYRALRILKEVDIIAAEDTRHTRILLSHYGIKTPTTSFYSYNQKTKIHYLLNLLDSGKNIALVTDSGTPGISDPGHEIIHQSILQNIPITSIPGPTALITAVISSGFHTNRFIFEGFLSSRQNARRQELVKIKDDTRTLIFYESPHRLRSMLLDMQDILGDRQIVLARELTKKFEEILRGKISELLATLPEHIKGEFTIVMEGQLKHQSISLSSDQIRMEIEKIVKSEKMDKKNAIKKLSSLTGIPRKEIYNACISDKT